MMKCELAGAVGVAGDAQIFGVPDISTDLELVVAPNLGPVVDELKLLFVFNQRTVATANVQSLAEMGNCLEVTRRIHEETRQTGRERIIGNVETRNAKAGGRVGSGIKFVAFGMVFEVSETEVGEKSGTENVIKAGS